MLHSFQERLGSRTSGTTRNSHNGLISGIRSRFPVHSRSSTSDHGMIHLPLILAASSIVRRLLPAFSLGRRQRPRNLFQILFQQGRHLIHSVRLFLRSPHSRPFRRICLLAPSFVFCPSSYFRQMSFLHNRQVFGVHHARGRAFGIVSSVSRKTFKLGNFWKPIDRNPVPTHAESYFDIILFIVVGNCS